MPNATDAGAPTAPTLVAPIATDAGPPNPFLASDDCTPAPGTTGSPGSIAELVELLNGLPRPVSLTCVLRSFDRPLALLATSNLISAQSAVGERSPRMFILSGKLSMSIVPAGDGRVFMEMGEYTTSAVVSIKGEILFPVTEPLDHRDPYRRILADERTGTKCSICHYPEGPVSTLGFEDAFESTAYRPHPQYDVSVDYMRSMHDTCDADVEPERCAIYSALFTHGDVVQAQFPEEMPIFD